MATPFENKNGFRPGTQADKERIYMLPLMDALEAISEDPSRAVIEFAEIENLKNGNAWVTAHSINFMRGTNVKAKVVIIDEAQNLTTAQLKMVLTRMHDDSVVIVIGHVGQIDIRELDSGFARYIRHFEAEPYASICKLTKNYRGRISTHADALTC